MTQDRVKLSEVVAALMATFNTIVGDKVIIDDFGDYHGSVGINIQGGRDVLWVLDPEDRSGVKYRRTIKREK